jgi:hypothetical protein
MTYHLTSWPCFSIGTLTVAQLKRTKLGYPKVGSKCDFNQAWVFGSAVGCNKIHKGWKNMHNNIHLRGSHYPEELTAKEAAAYPILC